MLRRGAGGSYYEELRLGDAVNMERLNSGAPLLNSHRAGSLSDIVGVVDRAWIDEKEGVQLFASLTELRSSQSGETSSKGSFAYLGGLLRREL